MIERRGNNREAKRHEKFMIMGTRVTRKGSENNAKLWKARTISFSANSIPSSVARMQLSESLRSQLLCKCRFQHSHLPSTFFHLLQPLSLIIMQNTYPLSPSLRHQEALDKERHDLQMTQQSLERANRAVTELTKINRSQQEDFDRQLLALASTHKSEKVRGGGSYSELQRVE